MNKSYYIIILCVIVLSISNALLAFRIKDIEKQIGDLQQQQIEELS